MGDTRIAEPERRDNTVFVLFTDGDSHVGCYYSMKLARSEYKSRRAILNNQGNVCYFTEVAPDDVSIKICLRQ
jgi:hypothetical protein